MAEDMVLQWASGSPPCWRVKRYVPSYKLEDLVVDESYADCFYLEQTQFKLQGNQLVPDCPAEQALMYQCMLEGLIAYEKHTKTNKPP